MSTYLVIAHQTLGSVEFLDALKNRIRLDDGAQFVLLVPETAREFLATEREGSPREVARAAAAEAAVALGQVGVRVRWTIISDQTPIVALETELADHPETYAGIIISTFPAGMSRWLEDYLIQRAQSMGLPIEHVVATSVQASEAEPVME